MLWHMLGKVSKKKLLLVHEKPSVNETRRLKCEKDRNMFAWSLLGFSGIVFSFFPSYLHEIINPFYGRP